MRIRSAVPVLWRAPGESQIGTDREYSIIFDSLTRPEQEALAFLAEEVGREDLFRRARSARVPLVALRAMINRLDQAGLLVDTDGPRRCDDAVFWEQFERDQDPGGSGPTRMQILRASTVAILGADYLASRVAVLLAQAGIGTILAESDGVTQTLRLNFPHVATQTLPGRPIDLVVSCDSYVSDPVRDRALEADQLPHLLVTAGEARVSIGPLLGLPPSPCRGCLDLWESDADPCWSVIATQARSLAPPILERLLIHHASVMVTRAALDCLTDPSPWWCLHSQDVLATPPHTRVHTWAPHPRCLCAASMAQVGARSSTRTATMAPSPLPSEGGQPAWPAWQDFSLTEEAVLF